MSYLLVYSSFCSLFIIISPVYISILTSFSTPSHPLTEYLVFRNVLLSLLLFIHLFTCCALLCLTDKKEREFWLRWISILLEKNMKYFRLCFSNQQMFILTLSPSSGLLWAQCLPICRTWLSMVLNAGDSANLIECCCPVIKSVARHH